MASRGKSARVKGHTFEREIAEFFRSLGCDTTTSRYSSKQQDDLKVDLVDTGPFSVQCKAVENLGPPHKWVKEMPEDGRIRLLFHKLSRKGTMVSMSLEDFEKVAKKFLSNDNI